MQTPAKFVNCWLAMGSVQQMPQPETLSTSVAICTIYSFFPSYWRAFPPSGMGPAILLQANSPKGSSHLREAIIFAFFPCLGPISSAHKPAYVCVFRPRHKNGRPYRVMYVSSLSWRTPSPLADPTLADPPPTLADPPHCTTTTSCQSVTARPLDWKAYLFLVV